MAVGRQIFRWKYLTAGEWILAVVLLVPTFGIGFIILAAVAVYHQFLLRHTIEITDDRIVVVKKFITERTSEDYLKNIVEYDIQARNGFWEAVFGAINICVTCHIRRGIDNTRQETKTFRIARKDRQAFQNALQTLMEKKMIVVGSSM
jgi:hypothetical protein